MILVAILPMLWCATSASAKADKKQVTLYVDIHCQGCIDKIMSNIAYEKGVKDIQCDLQKKTVVVTYNANKTDVPTLQKAFAKIGKPATVAPLHAACGDPETTAPTEGCETPQKESKIAPVDAQSGATKR